MRFGLQPKPRAGQVWHVEYAEWPKGVDVHHYFLLLRPGEVHEWDGKKTESWHVFDLEKGTFYAGDMRDTYSMPFEYENGAKQLPHYTLVSEGP